VPNDLSLWKTVYQYWRAWGLDGTRERFHIAMREPLRVTRGRNNPPSAVIVGSPSVTTTWIGGKRGYSVAKKLNRRR
jgi:putative transposase